MASIGTRLVQPESGWRRFDDVDPNISYTANFRGSQGGTDGYPDYKATRHQVGNNTQPQYARFNFVGTKIRLIGMVGISDNYINIPVYIKIDGIEESFSLNPVGDSVAIALLYEKNGLSYTEHSVEIIVKNNTNGSGFMLDAIDINDTGILKPFSLVILPPNLRAVSSDSQVSLSWNIPAGAISFNVKRATVPGGPYDTIATNITENSYIDTKVGNNITYYYVIAGLNGTVESNNSNQVSVTPSKSVEASAIQYFARTTPPGGWLTADGAVVSRIQYPDLFSAIGVTYGNGDGSTTFNLPDLRGEFIRGLDNNRGVDAGRTLGSEQLDAFKGFAIGMPFSGKTGTAGYAAFAGASAMEGSISINVNGAFETRPRNIALLACIKY